MIIDHMLLFLKFAICTGILSLMLEQCMMYLLFVSIATARLSRANWSVWKNHQARVRRVWFLIVKPNHIKMYVCH